MNPKTQKANLQRRPDTHKRSTIIQEQFSGPIPHPRLLSGYETIHKGLADRIVSMAERQSLHRQTMEKTVVESNIFNEKLGIVLAFMTTLSFVGGGIFLIYSNKEIIGFATLIGVFAFYAYNFIRHKKEDKNDRKTESSK